MLTVALAGLLAGVILGAGAVWLLCAPSRELVDLLGELQHERERLAALIGELDA